MHDIGPQHQVTRTWQTAKHMLALLHELRVKAGHAGKEPVAPGHSNSAGETLHLDKLCLAPERTQTCRKPRMHGTPERLVQHPRDACNGRAEPQMLAASSRICDVPTASLCMRSARPSSPVAAVAAMCANAEAAALLLHSCSICRHASS